MIIPIALDRRSGFTGLARVVLGGQNVLMTANDNESRGLSQELDLARREVHALGARLDAILKAAVDGLIIIDQRGTIECFNPAAERIFGYRDEEVIGRNIKMLMPSPYREEHDGHLHNYLATGVRKIIGIGREVEGRRRDGSVFPMDIAVGEFVADGERRFVGIVRDITVRKEAEADAREQRERLAHVDRLSTMGEMASGIAHEINQPLTAIATYARATRRMLEKGLGSVEELGATLEQIGKQAERAGEVIRRLRAFMRKRESINEQVDLNEQLRVVIRLAEVDARHHDCRIDAELAADLPAVHADAVQIQQVALNLIRNAIDATEALPASRRVIHVRTRLPAPDRVEVQVEDQGPGVVDPDRLFTPFFTTKHEGMGLGLSISSSIVTAHGGRLWHEPGGEGGARFCFNLPVALGDKP